MPVKTSFHVLGYFFDGQLCVCTSTDSEFFIPLLFFTGTCVFFQGYAVLCLPSGNTISSLKQPMCPIVPLMDIFTAIHKNFFSRDLSSFSHGLIFFHGGEKTLVSIAQI